MLTYKILTRCLYQIQNDPNLPAFKPTARELVRVCQKPNISLDEVLAVVEIDEILAAKFLDLANSPMFTRGEPVATIKEALIRIGLNEVLRTGVLMVIFELVKKVKSADDPFHFWLHSVLTARFALKISAARHVSPEKAYVAGLMHDIGKRFLQCYFPEEFAELMHDGGEAAFDQEKQLFDTNHAEIGYILALRWSFNSEIALAIRYHHQPEEGSLAECVHHGSEMARRACLLHLSNEKPMKDSEDEALIKEYDSVSGLISKMLANGN